MSAPAKRIRVLYLVHTLARGGSASSLRYLIAQLPKDEVEAFVLAQPGPGRALFEDIGVSVRTIPGFVTLDSIAGVPLRGRRLLTLLRSAWALRHTGALRRTIRELRPDIVHLNERGMLHAAIVAKREGVPVIVHARTVADRQVKWFWRLSARILSRVDRVIAIDGSVAHSLRGVVASEVVYNPLPRLPSAPEPAKRDNGPSRVLRVTFLSGLLRFKGIWDLLDAARLLRNRRDIVFQIAGANPHSPSFYGSLFGRVTAALGLVEDMETSVRNRITRDELQDTVQLLGHVEDVDALLRGSDILVFPSHLNGPGRSVFEAGALGVPAVVAMRDRVEDVVEHDVTGVIVPEKDGRALADAITRLADDPPLRHRLGAQAREKYMKQFDAARSAASVLRIYREVAAGVSRP